MRYSTWIGGLALVTFTVLGWFAAQSAMTAPPPAKAADKAPADDRDELANKQLERVTLDDPIKGVALKEVIEFVTKKFDLNVIVDGKSFGNGPGAAAVGAADDDAVLNEPISIPAMKNVRVSTVMKAIADQVNGVFLIYPDHIKLVSAARAFTICGPLPRSNISPNDDAMESPEATFRAVPLVSANYQDKALADVLKDVESRTNRSIVLANQAGDKAKTIITARFTNVPVDTAVITLAEMAGLKMAPKGNVLLVTTAERAREFDPHPPAPTGLGGGGFFGAPVDTTAEELKKKIAELEKTVEELKAKK